jgi:hypothetical protein
VIFFLNFDSLITASLSFSYDMSILSNVFIYMVFIDASNGITSSKCHCLSFVSGDCYSLF